MIVYPCAFAQGFLQGEWMKKFTLKEKLSKKRKKELNAEKRIRWDFAPVSRVIPNKKKAASKKENFRDQDE